MSQNAFSSIEHDWNEPLPLPQGPPLLPWPENIFQEPFELYVKELARSTEVPVELPAMQKLNKLAVMPSCASLIRIPAMFPTAVNAAATARFSRGYRHWLFIHFVSSPRNPGGLFKSTPSMLRVGCSSSIRSVLNSTDWA